MSKIKWHSFDKGYTINQIGSEDGVIIRDEEQLGAARITLEKNSRTSPFAITCGIYGWLVHTRFFLKKEEAQAAFEEMQFELDNILQIIPEESDSNIQLKTLQVSTALSEFIKRFP